MAMQRTALLTLVGVIGYVGSQGALSASAYRGGETRDAAHPFSEMRLAQAAITPVRARGEPAREAASSQATSPIRAATAAIEPASAQATSGVRAGAAATEPASVTSSPSRIQVTPRATTTSQWNRLHGRRSSRAGMSVSMNGLACPTT